MGEMTDLNDMVTTTGSPAGTAPPRTPAEVSALVEEHLGLVNHVVFQVAAHFPRHVDRDELARAGALGLVEAARRYEEGRGVPFNRFAAQRIRGAIIDAVRAADWAPGPGGSWPVSSTRPSRTCRPGSAVCRRRTRRRGRSG